MNCSQEVQDEVPDTADALMELELHDKMEASGGNVRPLPWSLLWAPLTANRRGMEDLQQVLVLLWATRCPCVGARQSMARLLERKMMEEFGNQANQAAQVASGTLKRTKVNLIASVVTARPLSRLVSPIQPPQQQRVLQTLHGPISRSSHVPLG